MNIKKLLLSLLLIPFLFFVSCSADDSPEPKSELSGKTAAAYFAANELYLGWNMGNSLDGLDERAWLPNTNSANISQELMNGVKAAGFNVIRIPITWNIDRAGRMGRPIGPAPDYQLNEAWLQRVTAVVDMAYEAGLAVIINIHHDGAPAHASDDMFWLSVGAAANNANDYNEITAKFKAVWKQIAAQFKDYGDWLIFEGFNELHNTGAGGGAWGWNVPQTQLDVINKWNQAFTDAVREAGGNNTERFLVIQPICARVHMAVDPSFILPTDTAQNKQIVSMHWYYPENFCLRGNSGYNITWGTEADKNLIVNGSDGSAGPQITQNTGSVGFKHFKDKYTSKGIPVIIGEWGVTYQGGRSGTESETADANRTVYLKFFCEQAKAHGLTPIVWDNGYNLSGRNDENFGLLNRKTGEPLGEREDALVKTMVNAVK